MPTVPNWGDFSQKCQIICMQIVTIESSKTEHYIWILKHFKFFCKGYGQFYILQMLVSVENVSSQNYGTYTL